MYRTAIINSSTPDGVWLNLAVTNQLDLSTYAVTGSATHLVAPAGTAFVRYQVVFRQPANAAGAVLFDDLNLAAPETPGLVTATKSGNSFNLSFPTYAGLTYQVHYHTNLADPGWSLLTNVLGDGAAKTVADALTDTPRFYRVVRVCN
jgi:hypothetical protein